MIQSIIYAIFAAFALSFLVFIHELGHYIVAIRKGMKVEVFSIGFGKAIYSWKRGDVTWQIGMLPFGGYVKIAGMEAEKGQEPYQVEQGFYSKKPKDRIAVALAGPIVNIVFAFIIFSSIWMLGGRQKPFAELTKTVGWVGPSSEWSKLGIIPGDEISGADNQSINSIRSFPLTAILHAPFHEIRGYTFDYFKDGKTPFVKSLAAVSDKKAFSDPKAIVQNLIPASYVVFGGFEAYPELIKEQSPLYQSGIEKGDRVVWAQGQVIFSIQQLSDIINSKIAMMRFVRNGQEMVSCLPRAMLSEYKLTTYQKAEIGDWQNEAYLNGKLKQLYFIPYNVDSSLVVQGAFEAVDKDSKSLVGFVPLQHGDKILSVDGFKVQSSADLLSLLQTQHLQLIVQRGQIQDLASQNYDEVFEKSFQGQELTSLVKEVGSTKGTVQRGNFILLNTITPISYAQLPLSEKALQEKAHWMEQGEKQLKAIKDPQKRAEIQKMMEGNSQKLVVGARFNDEMLTYNPAPTKLFSDAIGETIQTFYALFAGKVSPKWLVGPVGIVQVLQQGWSMGVKEALYFMGIISLNLGILNLLPLPVLDGGHIAFSLYEAVTKRRISAKTMQKLIIPFMVLLVGMFVFVTYHDIMRILSRFF